MSAQDEVEIAYDDGTMEEWWRWFDVGGAYAVLFTPPFKPFVLVKARIFFREGGPFQLVVYDCETEPSKCHESITKTADASAMPERQWFSVDLAERNVRLEGGFFVAVEWTSLGRPSIGLDTNASQDRSWRYDPASRIWTKWSAFAKAGDRLDGNIMIRATIRSLESSITVDAEPRTIPLTVDGQTVQSRELPKTYRWTPGSRHTISAPEMIEGDAGVRHVFVQWSDGSRERTRTVVARESTKLIAVYKTQYLLTVRSEFGNPQGAGWYDAGSRATFSVAGTSGFIIVQVFDSWSEDASGSTPTSTIIMDSPRTVVARWRADYTQLLLTVGVAGIVAAVGLARLMSRRKRAPPLVVEVPVRVPLPETRQQEQPQIPPEPQAPPHPVVQRALREVSTRTVEPPIPEGKPSAPESIEQRIISTGYVELDRNLIGGLPEGYAILLLSPAYDERELLLRKVIQSVVSSGRPTFYVSSDAARTRDLCSRYQHDFYGFSQSEKKPSDLANFHGLPRIENLSDLNIALGKAIAGKKLEERLPKVMILDILSDALLIHKAVTTRRWLADFIARRKDQGFTVLATLNPLVAVSEETQTIIDLFDGVIEIYERELKERSRRFLVVRKMYGRRYSDSELMLERDRLF